MPSVIDRTAMILIEMKNNLWCPSPSPPASPSELPENTSCTCDCMLCERGTPFILSKCHTWAWIMRAVFFSLRERYPSKKFLSLKNDIYEYMINHWGALGLDKKPSANWHKQIQDMLSHSRNIFESGMNHYRQNGFWRLKDLEDPWTSKPDSPRTTSPPPTQQCEVESPRKRAWKTTEDTHSEGDASPNKRQRTPTSPLSLPSSPPQLSQQDDPLEKEVAVLREQLAQMSEGIVSLSHDVMAVNDYPPKTYKVFNHNRVWEDNFTTYASVLA